ncbi:hypothetical protein RND81_10G191400 [Saponaria officinalis]|uniref:Uncharacterized protein n=1 Tax=Saponaria officinalis TaxID=3572 RepID=A0AAW1I3K1_SAPOF
MQAQQLSLFKLLFCSSFLLTLLHLSTGTGLTTRCVKNGPSINQTQVGKAKFRVDVVNNCGTCPVTDIHVKCGRFPQSLVDPKMFKVLKFDDCVVNSGLPLLPLQTLSFNYSRPRKYPLFPTSWFFQCE